MAALGTALALVGLVMFIISYIMLWLKVDHLVEKLAPVDEKGEDKKP